MQITIDVPDWMAGDLSEDEGKEFSPELVERALLAYYKEIYDPLTGKRTKIFLNGSF